MLIEGGVHCWKTTGHRKNGKLTYTEICKYCNKKFETKTKQTNKQVHNGTYLWKVYGKNRTAPCIGSSPLPGRPEGLARVSNIRHRFPSQKWNMIPLISTELNIETLWSRARIEKIPQGFVVQLHTAELNCCSGCRGLSLQFREHTTKDRRYDACLRRPVASQRERFPRVRFSHGQKARVAPAHEGMDELRRCAKVDVMSSLGRPVDLKKVVFERSCVIFRQRCRASDSTKHLYFHSVVWNIPEERLPRVLIQCVLLSLSDSVLVRSPQTGNTTSTKTVF